MKYGIYYAYWEKQWGVDYNEYIEKTARLGFDVLEISCASLDQISNSEIRRLKATKESFGMSLTAGYGPKPSQNIASKDPDIVKNAFKFWEKVFNTLYILGVDTIGGGLYHYWPVDFSQPFDKKEDWERAVQGISLLADEAQKYGINLCMESLNRHEGYLINTAAECVDFVKQTGKKNVFVMLDTYHMNMEEDDMVEAIHTAGGYLGHFHVGENNRKLPGQGKMIDWKAIGQALRDIGYDKAVVMEPFVQMGGQVGSDIKVWRDLSNNADMQALDAQAAESVSFLREIF